MASTFFKKNMILRTIKKKMEAVVIFSLSYVILWTSFIVHERFGHKFAKKNPTYLKIAEFAWIFDLGQKMGIFRKYNFRAKSDSMPFFG